MVVEKQLNFINVYFHFPLTPFTNRHSEFLLK